MLATISMLLIAFLVYLYVTAPQPNIQQIPVAPLNSLETSHDKQKEVTLNQQKDTIIKTRLPKILWIYTYHKW